MPAWDAAFFGILKATTPLQTEEDRKFSQNYPGRVLYIEGGGPNSWRAQIFRGTMVQNLGHYSSAQAAAGRIKADDDEKETAAATKQQAAVLKAAVKADAKSDAKLHAKDMVKAAKLK